MKALLHVALALALVAQCGGRLDKLRKFRVECFPVLPCVMGLDREKMFGCGQCNSDSVVEEPIEFSQAAELFNFISNSEATEKRFLLVPDVLFFRRSVLATLPFAENVAGIVVFPGLPGGDDGEDASGEDEDDEAAQVETYSVDDDVPNRDFSLSIFPYNAVNQTSADRTRADQFRFFPFNIFRVDTTVAGRIRNRIAALNNQNNTEDDLGASPLAATSRSSLAKKYVLQSNGRMFACPSNAKEITEDGEGPLPSTTTNSTQCLNDRTCKPIGGHSVWSSLGVLQAPAKKEVLAVTAPMDTTAFFHDVAQGAAAEVSSLATLMAVAEAVGAWRRGPGKSRVMIKQPVYFAFNAQSWGWAGSSRFLQDVADFQCTEKEDIAGCRLPYKESLRFQDFKSVSWSVLNLAGLLDPQQSGQPEDASEGKSLPKFPFYWHAANRTSGQSTDVRGALEAAFGDTNLSRSGVTGVPPDASQSFAQFLPSFESVSLANYESTFSNKLWHSEFDNVSLIPPRRRQPLVTAANGIARTIISLSFGEADAEVDVNRATIDGFIDCFTTNWTATPCALAKEYQVEKNYEIGNATVRATNYAGVFFPNSRAFDRSPGTFAKTDLVRSFLAYQNRFDEESDSECDSHSACSELADKLSKKATNESSVRIAMCVRKTCVASDTFLHDAYGTGIEVTKFFSAEKTQDVEGGIDDKSQFATNSVDTANATAPQSPQYTESDWGNLGLCGYTEDSRLFGIVVLIGGIGNTLGSLLAAILLQRILFSRKGDADDDIEAAGDELAPTVGQ